MSDGMSQTMDDVRHMSTFWKSILSLEKFDAGVNKFSREKRSIGNYERSLDYSRRKLHKKLIGDAIVGDLVVLME